MTRTATVDDAGAIAVAHTRAWQKAYAEILPADFLAGIDVDLRTESWRQNLSQAELPDGTPSPLNLVAVAGDQVVGFACVGVWRDGPQLETAGEVWAIYVHPDWWGTGAGYSLMSASIDHLANRDVNAGYLWVLEENALARRFYERQGWRADDVTKEDTIADVTVTERRYSIALG